jgi:hypothetical protein
MTPLPVVHNAEVKEMKKYRLFPDPDSVRPGAYIFDKAVPVNIFINGQKVEAPKAGIKVGRPMNPAVDHGTAAIVMGDFIVETKKEIYIDGHKVEYEMRGRYMKTGLEKIRFYNSGGAGSEPLDVLAYRLNNETDEDMVARVFDSIRMW